MLILFVLYGKEDNAVAFTSDTTTTSGKVKIDKDSSFAPSIDASIACFEKLSVVQKI